MKKISKVLLCSVLLSVAVSASGATLLDEADTIRNWKGAGKRSRHVKSGKFSARWANHPSTKLMWATNIPRDWSDYGWFSFWMYSEKANNARIRVMFESSLGKGARYYRYAFNVNWTGWKKFDVPLKLYGNSKKSAWWKKIKKVSFMSFGWGAKPLADTVLHIDEMKLVKSKQTRMFRRIKLNTFYQLTLLEKGEAFIEVRWLDKNKKPLPYKKTMRSWMRNMEKDRPLYVCFHPDAAWAEITTQCPRGASIPKVGLIAEKTTTKPRPMADIERDCKIIKQRFRAYYVLPKDNALDAGKLKESIDKSDERVAELIAGQIMDPSDKGYGSWGKIKDATHPRISYTGELFLDIRRMAEAYSCTLSKYHGNENVLKRIKLALKFGMKYIRIGEPHPGNWWAWDIGIPLRLSPTLLLIGDKLDKKMYDELICDLYDLGYNCRLFGFPGRRLSSGANSLWIARCAFNLAVMTKDEKLLNFAKETFSKVNRVTTKEGIQDDGSYLYHGYGLNMGYGNAHMRQAAEQLYLTNGTAYSFDDEAMVAFSKLFRDFAVWTVYRGQTNPYILGRGVARGASNHDGNAATTSLYMLAGGVESLRDAALAHIADYKKGSGISPAYRSPQSFSLAAAAGDRLNKKAPAGYLCGTRFYPYSDYFIARNDDFYCAVRMCSTRTKNWFSIHDENVQGFYAAEGTVVLMTDGREYPRKILITHPWDDLSGITRVMNLRPRRESMGHSTFVGGIALGDVGMCGMNYLLHKGAKSIRAKKSYFALKNAIIVLGADIKAAGTKSPAESMILTQPVLEEDKSYYIDGEKKAFTDGTISLKGKKSFYYRNTGVLLAGTDVSLKIETRTKTHRWIMQNKKFPKDGTVKYTRQFFSLQVNHGVNPTAGEYAAIILPAWKVADVAKAAENPPVKIVRNDKDIQAVVNADNSCASAVFYKAGNCKIGGLSRPGYLAWKKNDKGFSVAIFMCKSGKVTVKLPFAIDKNKLPASVKCISSSKDGSIITVTATARKQLTW